MKCDRGLLPSDPQLPPERHGWRRYLHPAFLEPLQRSVAAVRQLRATGPSTWPGQAQTKLLARVRALILDEIPRDPNVADYALGNTLGLAHWHWRRAKFLGRFRLFFRFHSRERIIVYGWVNDEQTLRKAGAATDHYAVFTQRLARQNPPDDWGQLVAEAQANAASARQVLDMASPAHVILLAG